MAKEELIEMNGVVMEILPDSRYRVTLDNGHTLVAYTGGKMKRIIFVFWLVIKSRLSFHLTTLTMVVLRLGTLNLAVLLTRKKTQLLTTFSPIKFI